MCYFFIKTGKDIPPRGSMPTVAQPLSQRRVKSLLYAGRRNIFHLPYLFLGEAVADHVDLGLKHAAAAEGDYGGDDVGIQVIGRGCLYRLHKDLSGLREPVRVKRMIMHQSLITGGGEDHGAAGLHREVRGGEPLDALPVVHIGGRRTGDHDIGELVELHAVGFSCELDPARCAFK